MLDPNTILNVAMPARSWDQILSVLGEAPAPWRITNPLIVELTRQCTGAQPQQQSLQSANAAAQQPLQQQFTPPPPRMPRPNGDESHRHAHLLRQPDGAPDA